MKTDVTSLRPEQRYFPLSVSVSRHSGTFRPRVTTKHATSRLHSSCTILSLSPPEAPEVGYLGIAEDLHPVGMKVDHVAGYHEAQFLDPRVVYLF